jgi:F-type H+-transporting ATPase subunit gamma
LISGFEEGDYDHIYIAYNQFQSAINQEQRVDRLLPVTSDDLEGDGGDLAGDSLFEPERDALLRQMLPKYIEVQIHRAMLDSAASEQGSRMTAMDSATNNAKDMIDRLTLQYNRARQAAITKELVEITSGAEALHG